MEYVRKFELPDLMKLASRYKWLGVLIVGGCTALFVALSFVLPKRFKASAVVNISTGYFQNTMVRDFVPEINDGSELRAQREAIIRSALDDAFLEKTGRELGLITAPAGDRKAAVELAGLRKRLEVVGLTPTNFQISFVGSSADSSLGITKAAFDRILARLREERRSSLVAIRDSVREQLESLSANKERGARASVEQKRAELEILRSELKSLQSRLSDQHPKIIALKSRVEALEQGLASMPDKVDDGSYEILAANPELAAELARKANLLTIAIKADQAGALDPIRVMERPTLPLSPLWPKKPLLMAWGFLIGLLVWVGVVAFLEYLAATRSEAKRFVNPDLGGVRSATEKVQVSVQRTERELGTWHEPIDQ